MPARLSMAIPNTSSKTAYLIRPMSSLLGPAHPALTVFGEDRYCKPDNQLLLLPIDRSISRSI